MSKVPEPARGEAAELGATAHFNVEGTWSDDLMTQVKAPAEIPPPNTN